MVMVGGGIIERHGFLGFELILREKLDTKVPWVVY